AKDGSSRLRQYYSIYVRITTGDMEKQYEKIRELLDAGIFVYSGGANTPRTLGNDTNPISQFKLTYRKLYGLSKLIGLTNGDRFELSGDQTEEWLNNPSKGKEILMKNVGGPGSNVDEGESMFEVVDLTAQTPPLDQVPIQQELGFESTLDLTSKRYEDINVKKLIESKTPKATTVTFNILSTIYFDVVIAALGFEERSLDAIKDILKLKFKKLLLIQYEEKGKSDEALRLVTESKVNFEIFNYDDVKTKFNIVEGTVLCDISGMSKSVIFNIV